MTWSDLYFQIITLAAEDGIDGGDKEPRESALVDVHHEMMLTWSGLGMARQRSRCAVNYREGNVAITESRGIHIE